MGGASHKDLLSEDMSSPCECLLVSLPSSFLPFTLPRRGEQPSSAMRFCLPTVHRPWTETSETRSQNETIPSSNHFSQALVMATKVPLAPPLQSKFQKLGRTELFVRGLVWLQRDGLCVPGSLGWVGRAWGRCSRKCIPWRWRRSVMARVCFTPEHIPRA